MMTDQTETKAIEAPKRSAARAALAARIANRQKAQQTIQDRQDDARRLTMIGEAAKALAAQLAGAKARDAAILAEHVVSRAAGRVPKLADNARGELIDRLSEAEAQAEAAVPALAIVEGKITEAFSDYNRAAVSVTGVTRPVIEEEIDRLVEETRAVMLRLAPLTELLAGARAYAYSQGESLGPDARLPYLHLGSKLDNLRQELGFEQRMSGHPSQGAWAAFDQRLTVDADAVVA